MNSAIFLQARLGSTRLKQKIIETLSGKTLIEHVVNRLKKALQVVDEIVVVTCSNSFEVLNDIFYDDKDVYIFSGSEENVLERFYQANQKFQKDIIIRATADNPFVSIEHLLSILKHHKEKNADYSHYIGLPLGSGVEVISASAINKAYQNAEKYHQKEHVTPYIYENPSLFHIEEPKVTGYFYRPDIRITIDEKEDFEVAENIFQHIYKKKNDSTLSHIIQIWDEKELSGINQNIQQKTLL